MAISKIDEVRAAIDVIYRADSRRVFATLVRLLGDFDLAEEALHDAFASAINQWPQDGIPENPRAWLVSAGRYKGIDTVRRRARFDASISDIANQLDAKSRTEAPADSEEIEDDRLRLIFTCCHPAIAPEAQVALTLREVCDLTTEAIACAFLTTPATLAQRIVRAKSKIRDAGIPFDVPSTEDLPDRIDAVLQVVYLVFNEGYAASSGDSLTRPDLIGEAIRLGRLLVELMPEAEVRGLLALMLLHESRRAARTTPSGELILLDDQDRTLWNRDQIEEGKRLISEAFSSGQVGQYTLQAAISAVHAAAPSAQLTNWTEIVGLYDLLNRATPSPIVELNRAVAISMRDSPAAGLRLIDAILSRGNLSDYHLAHAARADMLSRLGQTAAARAAYRQALKLARQEPERRFLEKKMAKLV